MTFLRLAFCHNPAIVVSPVRAAHGYREPRYALQSLLGNLKAFCVESFFLKILLIGSSSRAAYDSDRELRYSLQSLLGNGNAFYDSYFTKTLFWFLLPIEKLTIGIRIRLFSAKHLENR